MDHAVENGTTRRFIAALRTLEQDRGLEPMLELFTDDVQLSRLDGHGAYTGRSGAEQFWTQYRETFSGINSSFTYVTEGERSAVLEWVARGELPNGRAIEYVGVSVLEMDGDAVSAFRTYYDSAAFVAGDDVVGAGGGKIDTGEATRAQFGGGGESSSSGGPADSGRAGSDDTGASTGSSGSAGGGSAGGGSAGGGSGGGGTGGGGTGGPSAPGAAPGHDDVAEAGHTSSDSGVEPEEDRAAARGDATVGAGEVQREQQ